MNPFNETRIPVELGRDAKGTPIPRILIFNVNTIGAYEEVSGKPYWDTVLAIFDVYGKYGPKLNAGETVPSAEALRSSSTDILRHIRIKDVHQLTWAALHEYDGEEQPPRWPLTIAKVGRLINTWDTIPMLAAIVRGIQQNVPTAAEMGEAKGAGPQLVEPAEAAQMPSANGGQASIALDAAAFA